MTNKPRIECLPLFPAVPAGQAHELTLLIRTQSPELPKNPTRPPLNIALVIDRSGSMGRHKIAMAKQAALAAVNLLSP